MTVIGEDTSERLDVIPAQFRVIVTKRPKLACRACTGTVVQAPAPARLIEGGIPTEALVAHVLVARYADHLPLYRQAQIMQRQGVILERSTLSFWMGYAAAEVAPVVVRLREMMLASTRIFADETVVPVLDPGRGRTKQGYFWAMARDDRPWGGSEPPAVVYSYAPGRGHIHANPRQHVARWLPWHPAVRWIPGLQETRRAQADRDFRNAGILLEPRAQGLLRSGQDEGADRRGNAAAHCRAL
jgi:transposase